MDRSSRPSSRRTVPVLAAAAAAALLVAGCSSSSGGKQTDESGDAVSAGQAGTPRLTVAMITHAAPCLLYTSDAADE